MTDGGHLMEPKDNCSFSYNTGTQLRRMAQEIQGNTPSSGLRVVGNVFSDWVQPYYDSFGVSVVNDKSNGTLIEGNDLRATIASGSTWGIADGGGAHRFGYGIEAGGNGIIVQNNILVGNWIAGVCASTPATVQNNRKFGPPNWGDWTTEAAGKITAANNTVDRNIADGAAARHDATDCFGGGHDQCVSMRCQRYRRDDGVAELEQSTVRKIIPEYGLDRRSGNG